jgi:glycosyltransferase involved in cell wall biosynthesis
MDYALTIAIPTYNRASRLAETLGRWITQIERNPGQPCQIVVGDNSTNHDTASMMRDYLERPYIKYLGNGGNIGYGHSINKILLNSDGEFVWLFGDNDIPLDDTLERVLRLLADNPAVDCFALDNRCLEDDTRAVVTEKTFFRHSGTWPGPEFLRTHAHVYAIGGIGTNLYRTAAVKRVVEQLRDRTTAHHTTVLTGALVSDGRLVCVPDGVYYCDTRYEKGYSCREKFELGIQSHVRSMLLIEEYAQQRVFDRSAHRRPFLKRIGALMCIHIVGNKRFAVTHADVREFSRFDSALTLGLLCLALSYRIPHKLLRFVVRASFRLAGRSAATFEAYVQTALIGDIGDHRQNRYLAEAETH